MQELMRRGTELLRRGSFEEALRCFTQILARDPSHVGALYNQGASLHSLGHLQQAVASYRQLLRLQPRHDGVLANLGSALAGLGRPAEALACFEEALAVNPGLVRASIGKSMALEALDRLDDGLNCLIRAGQLAPGNIDVLNQMAVMFSRAGRLEEALARLRQARSAAPANPIVAGNLATALLKLGRPEQALPVFEDLLALQPDNVEAWCNRGATLAALDRLAEARQCYERALGLEPRHAATQYNKSLAQLAQGELAAGFAGHECRQQLEALRVMRPDVSVPTWTGQQPVAGKSILLQHEQGLGDTVQFARYAPLLAAAGARVIIRVPQDLRGLLQTLSNAVQVISLEEAVPPHDLYCPMMSLPLAFGTDLGTIPAKLPYLQADAQRSALWADRLGRPRRFRVGLVWAGRQQPPVNYERDMALHFLRPLLDLDVDFVSLQKEIPLQDLGLLAQLPIVRWGENLDDLADAAALLANLDLVITVDTALAHVAGAVGRPVWIMNRFAPCWRWLRDREDSPWYPGARLFRQPRSGDWDAVVWSVRQALTRRLAPAA